MQEQSGRPPLSNYPNDYPDHLPPTMRRLRGDPSQSMHSTSFDSSLFELETMSVPVPQLPDASQPSMQMQALRRDQMAIATFIITGSFFASRLLGFFRMSIFGATFGASTISDAFTLSFTLPNAVYNIVAGGALSSAFIPVLTDYLVKKRDKKGAWQVTSAAINLTILIMTVFAIISAIFMPQLAHLFANGVFSKPGEAAQVIFLSRIMLLQPIILGLSVISTSVLQTRQRFLLPAIGSLLYNVGQIGGIFATIVDNHTGFFGGHLGILGPTYGVIIAAAMQFLIQVPGLLTAKVKYSLTLNFTHPGIIRIGQLMVPRLINAVALYVISAFVTSSLLSSINDSGAVYGYQQAFQLILMPISIFGMALSQAAFPSFAIFVSSGDWQRMRDTLLSSIRIILFLSIPTSLGMMVLAEPITRLLFVYGRYAPSKEVLTYVPLIFFAIGIPALSLIEILVRAYYALQDAKTAVTIGIIELAFVIAMSVILIDPMKGGGLALATSLGAIGEALVLLLVLQRRIGEIDLNKMFTFTAGVLAASLVAVLVTLMLSTGLAIVFGHYIHADQLSAIARSGLLFVQLAVAALFGSLTYYVSAKFLGIEDTIPLDRIMGKIGRLLHR